jgi:hypothetical protein
MEILSISVKTTIIPVTPGNNVLQLPSIFHSSMIHFLMYWKYHHDLYSILDFDLKGLQIVWTVTMKFLLQVFSELRTRRPDLGTLMVINLLLLINQIHFFDPELIFLRYVLVQCLGESMHYSSLV